MITETAITTMVAESALEYIDLKRYLGQLNLSSEPIFNDALMTVTITVIQIHDKL